MSNEDKTISPLPTDADGNKYRVEACQSPIGETGDYDSWLELVCENFNLQCYDPNVDEDEIKELADKLNSVETLTTENANLKQEVERLKNGGWISVGERLPEMLVEVLAINEYGRIFQVSWMAHTNRPKEWFISEFTYWQPLPPIPNNNG